MTAPTTRGRFHHAAAVVSSLPDSIEFYRSCFGGELDLHLTGVEGEEMAELHGLPRARFDLAYIRYGAARVELFQFHDPPPDGSEPPAANQIGAAHIAFEVDDVHAAYRDLSGRGVPFSRPPLEVDDGDASGFVLAFLADPDGNRIELISPAGAGERERPAKLVGLTVAAGGRERFLELFAAVTGATDAEPGAEQYALHEVAGEPNRFWIYERYEDEAAAAAHHEQPALGRLLSALGPLLDGEPRIEEMRTVEAIDR